MGGPGSSPCASCKLLRRRCAKDCIFAPYFPPDDPHKFAIVHKVFGASNVSKMLQVPSPSHFPITICYILVFLPWYFGPLKSLPYAFYFYPYLSSKTFSVCLVKYQTSLNICIVYIHIKNKHISLQQPLFTFILFILN